MANKVSSIDVSINNDYAVLEAGGVRFCYGYEEIACPVHGGMGDHQHYKFQPPRDQGEWALVATEGGREVLRKSSRELGRDQFSVIECLLTGIGAYLRCKAGE